MTDCREYPVRAILFNQNAFDRVLEMWPDYIQTANNQARGMETPGQRGLITQSPLRALLHQLLREQPTPAQYGEGFKKLVKEHYAPAGISTFGSKLNTGKQISAYHYMLRKEGRLPVRFAYSYDLARQSIPTAAMPCSHNQGLASMVSHIAPLYSYSPAAAAVGMDWRAKS